MFSLLKRCKYSLYSDTMLHYRVNKPLKNYMQSETNEDGTYVHLKNFILVDLDTLLCKLEVHCTVLYTELN